MEKNNNWKFTDNFGTSQNTVIAEIRPAGTHWEIAGIYVAPPAVSHSQDAELFVVTRDLQNWRGYYKDHVVNCDSFEAHQHDEKTICTSQFGVKKVGAALAGILIGGNGKSYYTYDDDKVAAAIQSIRVSQALEKLDAFEKQ